VIYADINDPYGLGLLSFSEGPDYFVGQVRDLLNREPFLSLTLRSELTMLGRTYTIGYEAELERVLITRPIERITNPAWPWAVWYPLQRSGHFEQLSTEEQRVILMEHGGIGRAYGQAELVHDVRLACHGLGTEDNDFIIGLLGKELYPLSQMVQRMRKTKQTSLYLERLGPFFVGKAIWQNRGNW
jgi:chlorite dismutase